MHFASNVSGQCGTDSRSPIALPTRVSMSDMARNRWRRASIATSFASATISLLWPPNLVLTWDGRYTDSWSPRIDAYSNAKSKRGDQLQLPPRCSWWLFPLEPTAHHLRTTGALTDRR